MRVLAVFGLFWACDVGHDGSTPPAVPTPRSESSSPVRANADEPRAADPESGRSRGNVIEAKGLRFTVQPRLQPGDDGFSIQVDVKVESADGEAHVIYGFAKGIAFGGIRFGNTGGGMPLSEGGKVSRYGRVRPGSHLTIGRGFPGPSPGGGWTPLQPGDSLILSLRTWHTVGNDPVGAPIEVEIGAVTVRVSDAGEATVKVERSKT